MPKRTSTTGSELFIVDNSDDDWKVLSYLHDWCPLSKSIDIASGSFEIGALLALKNEWQKVDAIRIQMGDVAARSSDMLGRVHEYRLSNIASAELKQRGRHCAIRTRGYDCTGLVTVGRAQ